MKIKLQFDLFAICGIVLMNSLGAGAQVPNWQWAKSAGGNNWDAASSITSDISGNVYMAGNIGDTCVFGSITLYGGGMCLAKYDGNGNILWAENIPGGGASSISSDASANIYVAGFFTSPTITFGSYTLINADNTGSMLDMFIVKFDSSGNVLWAKSAGGVDWDYASCISVDAANNIYLAGSFNSQSIVFGSTTLNNTNVGYPDMFLAKYDVNGNVLWAKSAGGINANDPSSVVADVYGNVYVSGNFLCPMIIDTITLNNASVTYYDMFLIKYDVNGNVLWAKGTGGNSDDIVNSITADASGNIYMTGYFRSFSIIFGSTTLNNDNAGKDDMFLVKYAPNGNILWAISPIVSSDGYGFCITSDTSNNIYVTGWFLGQTIIFGSTTLNNAGINDLFLVKYDSVGNTIWAKSTGGIDNDIAYSVTANVLGNVYIAGDFQSASITFGSSTLINTNTSHDIFIAKLGVASGIESVENKISVSVFPNPSTGIFQITSGELRITNIEIINVLGEKVTPSLVPSPNEGGLGRGLVIDLSSQPKGIYFYKVSGKENETVTGKIIIE